VAALEVDLVAAVPVAEAAVQEDPVVVAPVEEVIDNFSVFCNFVPARALTRHEK
jgi:hypothetical protein